MQSFNIKRGEVLIQGLGWLPPVFRVKYFKYSILHGLVRIDKKLLSRCSSSNL